MVGSKSEREGIGKLVIGDWMLGGNENVVLVARWSL